MAPLTWRNVDSPSFASANQLYSLSAELMNRGFSAASRGLDKFREITTDEQSARLMQDVMAAGNNPAAIQAAATRGNAAFLSPEALRFANAQPGVLLDRQQAEARIGLTGVQTEASRYALDRTRITDGRGDAQYAARQEANPLIYRMQELARNGDLSGAQALAAQNADLLSRAGIAADTLYSGISSGFTGQMTDTELGVKHSDFMRVAGNARNARELIDLAGRAFGTEADARRGIQDLQAQGLISADLAQTALGSLGSSGLWTAPTAADEIMQRYGAAPMSGRGSTDPSWAGNWLSYTNQGAIRNQPISPELQSALSFAPQMGLRVEVYSGGETADRKASDSGRHMHGGAADVRLYDAATGRMLDSSRPEDRARIEAFTEEAAARGVVGQGHGEDYMGTNAFHVGFGKPAVWGANGKGKNAPDWYRDAYNRGIVRGGGTPLSFGSNVPRAGTQRGGSTVDQLMAAAVQDPIGMPLSNGQDNLTMDARSATALTGQPDSVLRMADRGGPSLEAMVASPELARQNPAMVSQLLEKALRDNPGQPPGGEYFNNALERSTSAAMAEANAALPETIIAEGTTGENPLFTQTGNGVVVARPPRNQQETQLIARAARAGILGTTPERAARQTETDRATQLMTEAGGQAPNVSVRPERTDGTGFQNDLNSMLRQGDITGGINLIADGIATGQYGPAGSPMARGFGGLLDYFSVTPEEAARNSADREAAASAIEWWRSPEARSYFEQNPNELEAASQNPVLFAQQMARQAPGTPPSQQGGQQGGQQTPARTQGEGQPSAATPTRPPSVTATDLASLLRTARSTERVDRSLNPFAPMDELLAGDNALSGDAAAVAQQLTADGGKLSYLDTRTVRENIRELMRIPGVNSAAVAGALLAQNGVVYTGTEWNPFNWGSDDQLDADHAAEIWKQYQRPDEEGRTGIEAGVARLNNRGRTETAVEGIAQVQADYEALVKAMNEQIIRAPNQAQKDAIRQHFEKNVFPLLYEKVKAIGESGALTTYSGSSTGQ